MSLGTLLLLHDGIGQASCYLGLGKSVQSLMAKSRFDTERTPRFDDRQQCPQAYVY
jgi:hypothetical protein